MKQLRHKIRNRLAGLAMAGASFGQPSVADEPKDGLAKVLQGQGIEFVDRTNVRVYDADIPGAETIEEYLVENSPYELIHVRQVHINGIVPEQYLRELCITR